MSKKSKKKSQSHKFGQIIGAMVEAAIEPILREFAKKHDLYLDRKGERPARRGKKVEWLDSFGNVHDLDFVLERGGTDDILGSPVAFIESAWRRYTRHSRNKAQEIQGAILPLITTHKDLAPFFGVVIAGEFTEGALKQLQSRGFETLYIPYEIVVKSFQVSGIDASYDEDTPESELESKSKAWIALDESEKDKVFDELLRLSSAELNEFLEELEASVTRSISRVLVLPLHGIELNFTAIKEAISFIKSYDEKSDNTLPNVGYEIEISYDNGDKVHGVYGSRKGALAFLEKFLPITYQPATGTP